MEERRNVGENTFNSGDGTDQTGPILDVYDDEDDDDHSLQLVQLCFFFNDHVRSSEYVESNGRMFDELLTKNALKQAAMF